MSKRIKTFLLFSAVALSVCMPNTSLYSMKKGKEAEVPAVKTKKEPETVAASKTSASLPKPPGSDNKKSSWWKKTLFKGLMLAAINIVLSDIVREILSLAKSKDVQEREKVESLLAINNALKKNMEYVRTKFRRNKVIKEMEQKFINSCSKIMDMHIEYLQKYGNNGSK